CLPSSRPMLDVFLALNCLICRFVNFKMDEAVNAITFGKTINHFIPMFVYATDKVVGDADIEGATRTACKNVHIELTHGMSFMNRDGRDKPGHDGRCQ